MYHFSFVSLDEGKNSVAYYSRANPITLIVFVHGFMGQSVETWSEFTPLLFRDEKFQYTDLVFYGYDSTNGQAYDQSVEFFKFLKIHQNPDSKKLLRSSTKEYEKILIVAHSLGSVVSRYAILAALRNNYQWAKKIRLLLFAPAHNGARLDRIVRDNPSTLLNIFRGLIVYIKPIVLDLAESSNCLKQLVLQTEKYRGKPEAINLSASVVHAFGDKIVNNGTFCYDEELDESPIRNSSHTKICKPIHPNYLVPIDIIKKVL